MNFSGSSVSSSLMTWPSTSSSARRPKTLIRVLQAMPMSPWYDWESHLAELGDAVNIPDLAERVNYEGMKMHSMMMFGQQVAGAFGREQPSASMTANRSGAGQPGQGGMAGGQPVSKAGARKQDQAAMGAGAQTGAAVRESGGR